MSTRYSSVPAGSATPAAPVSRVARRTGGWVFSLTGICFVFGAALAMQMRSVESAQKAKVKDASLLEVREKQSAQLRLSAARASQENEKSQRQIAELRKKLLNTGALTMQQIQQVKALNAQLSNLQLAAGLTRVSGPGIRITMDDSPSAPKNADAGSFLPGIIHDFDLLQIVNELRLMNAEAICIKGAGQSEGTRITAYTPIRCVGAPIQIEGQPVAPPFVIEAIGNPQALDKGVNMAGGILTTLKDPSRGPALQIKTEQINKLTLPASSGAPRFKAAKPTS